MSNPQVSQKFPYVIQETPGKKAWCACGLSKRQPYCDGSHKGTGLSPVIVEIQEARTISWCGCKHSGRKPYCDGSHAELP